VTWRCAAHQPRVAPFHLRFHPPLTSLSFRVSLSLSFFFFSCSPAVPSHPSLFSLCFVIAVLYVLCQSSRRSSRRASLSRSPPSSSSSSSSTRIEYSYFSSHECSRAPFSVTFLRDLVLSLPPISRGCNFPCPCLPRILPSIVRSRLRFLGLLDKRERGKRESRVTMSSSAPQNLRLSLRKILDFNGDDRREPFPRYPLPFQHLIRPHPPASSGPTNNRGKIPHAPGNLRSDLASRGGSGIVIPIRRHSYPKAFVAPRARPPR
jgi:hypothetical protein